MNENEKEIRLIQLAGKAVGYTVNPNGRDVTGEDWYWCEELRDNWNPLHFDSDAFSLALDLRLDVSTRICEGDLDVPEHTGKEMVFAITRDVDSHGDPIAGAGTLVTAHRDIYTAARWVIVNAAAVLGATIEKHEGRAECANKTS